MQYSSCSSAMPHSGRRIYSKNGNLRRQSECTRAELETVRKTPDLPGVLRALNSTKLWTQVTKSLGLQNESVGNNNED